jgi:molybdopterin molybdotransferase
VISSGEALDAILAAMRDPGTETVAVPGALSRTLRQSAIAERDQPPFDRVMMDGIAIRYDDLQGGLRRFPVQATQAAGDPQATLIAGNCIEIMTGASLPVGADCVVPVERLTIASGCAEVEAAYEADRHQFIHARGSDHRRGAELLLPGRRISPLDVAVLLSCGLTDVVVTRLPVVRVVTTGNELVPAGQPIEPHQVRLSNGPAMVAMLAAHGFGDASHEHLVDDPALLENRIGELLGEADVLILSGGVSMGKADYVPRVLEALGVTLVFHKIRQRPGKPMWFGTGPGGQAVFALPGNPVSSLVCCREYVITGLRAAAGLRPPRPEFATLARDVSFEPKLTCFQPVSLISNVGGQLLAMPVHTNTSGDFAALAATDGYVELPPEPSLFAAGTAVRLRRWQRSE